MANVVALITVRTAHAVFGRARLTQLVATLVKFSVTNDFAVVKILPTKRAAVGLLTRLPALTLIMANVVARGAALALIVTTIHAAPALCVIMREEHSSQNLLHALIVVVVAQRLGNGGGNGRHLGKGWKG